MKARTSICCQFVGLRKVNSLCPFTFAPLCPPVGIPYASSTHSYHILCSGSALLHFNLSLSLLPSLLPSLPPSLNPSLPPSLPPSLSPVLQRPGGAAVGSTRASREVFLTPRWTETLSYDRQSWHRQTQKEH